MIDLDGVVARASRAALAPLTARMEAGVHALVGGRFDGPSIVLAVIAGHLRPRRGSARVLGFAPGDARVRQSVAYVPLDATLPTPFRVDETLAAATQIRGEPARDPVARLERFGLGALARRKVGSLARDEVRAVALVEALTSNANVLLVEEPLASVDARALGLVADALRSRAREGACVVFATGSSRDARALADEVLTFDRGALVRRARATDPLILAGPRGSCVRVLSSDSKRLAAALVGDPAIREVTIEEGLLVVGGADVASVAAAIARGALRDGITLEMLRPDLLRDDELRAAISGDAAGAYRAAYERSLGPVPRPAVAPEEPT